MKQFNLDYNEILDEQFIQNYIENYKELYFELEHINVVFVLKKEMEKHWKIFKESKTWDKEQLFFALGKPLALHLPIVIYRFALEKKTAKKTDIYNLLTFKDEILQNIVHAPIKQQLQSDLTNHLRALNTKSGFAKYIDTTRNHYLGHRLKNSFKSEPYKEIFSDNDMEMLIDNINAIMELLTFKGIEKYFSFTDEFNPNFKSKAETSFTKTLNNLANQ